MAMYGVQPVSTSDTEKLTGFDTQILTINDRRQTDDLDGIVRGGGDGPRLRAIQRARLGEAERESWASYPHAWDGGAGRAARRPVYRTHWRGGHGEIQGVPYRTRGRTRYGGPARTKVIAPLCFPAQTDLLRQVRAHPC